MGKLRWWYYWFITRKRQKIVPWIARKLPKKLKYYVVIDGVAHVTAVKDPNRHPDNVPAMELLEVFS